MRKQRMVLDRESLSRLAALIGEKWRFFGGENMPPQLHSAFEAFFVTDRSAITVLNEVEYLDFTGEEDTYSYLTVAAGAAGLDKARQKANLYLFDAGESIADVSVVRESTTEKRDGELTWVFTTDVAIVFELSRGVIAVSKLGQHDEMMQVTRAASLDDLDVPWISDNWQDQLGIEYARSRKLLQVENLIDGVCAGDRADRET